MCTVLQEGVYAPLYRDLSVDVMHRYNLMLKVGICLLVVSMVVVVVCCALYSSEA